MFPFFSSVDHGKVLKTINAASADDSSKVSSVVIEELDVLAKAEPIRNLKIVRTMQYGESLSLMYHYYRVKLLFGFDRQKKRHERNLQSHFHRRCIPSIK